MRRDLCRRVKGWPYWVTARGQVFRDGSPPGKYLKPHTDIGGYQVVVLADASRRWTVKIHRLVCDAWHGPKPDAASQVRHLDGDPSHNAFDNVCWGTAKQNAEDRARHGSMSYGSEHHNSVLTAAQAQEIRNKYQEHMDARLAAGRQRALRGFPSALQAEYGISQASFHRLVTGQTYVYE